MKRRTMIILVIVLLAGISFAVNQSIMDVADERIVKVAENNVVVQKVLYTKAGAEVVIDEKAYGQARVESEIAEAQAKLEYWQTVDPALEQAKVQAKIDKLNTILTKLSGPIDDAD